jgi:hypothetical protein
MGRSKLQVTRQHADWLVDCQFAEDCRPINMDFSLQYDLGYAAVASAITVAAIAAVVDDDDDDDDEINQSLNQSKRYKWYHADLIIILLFIVQI